MLTLISQGILLMVLGWVLRKLLSKTGLDNIPGPESDSFITGNLRQLFDSKHGWDFNDMLTEQCMEFCSSAANYLTCLRDQLAESSQFTSKHLHVHDPKALHHILVKIDILHWMGRAALEMIGQSGLGYSFDPLVEGAKPHPFSEAAKAFIPAVTKTFLEQEYLLPTLVKVTSPQFRRWALDRLPFKTYHAIRDIVDTWDRTTTEIFEGKKRALREGDEALAKQVGQAKDLMSILSKSSFPCLEPTIAFAATDTTSNALSRTLHLLATHPEAQERLRTEITEARKAHNGGDIPYDELVSLPFMDAVCRETLRVARQDIVLPLSTPIRGVDGRDMDSILVPKDTKIFISILNANRDPLLWGSDSLKWKPERWLAPLPEALHEAHMPGIYSHLLTFLGGGRACIGFKFSQLEMKVVLSTLISQFRLYPPEKEIVWQMSGITTPALKESPTFAQLPLRMEVVNAEA
ncbi:hypothetical protein DXG01_012522 [Tephrocybe rancida]|nr:hypothetical protein DXG01_012522 [Tephrocybe rancida]